MFKKKAKKQNHEEGQDVKMKDNKTVDLTSSAESQEETQEAGAGQAAADSPPCCMPPKALPPILEGMHRVGHNHGDLKVFLQRGLSEAGGKAVWYSGNRGTGELMVFTFGFTPWGDKWEVRWKWDDNGIVRAEFVNAHAPGGGKVFPADGIFKLDLYANWEQEGSRVFVHDIAATNESTALCSV
jgi:hypothetical protein